MKKYLYPLIFCLTGLFISCENESDPDPGVTKKARIEFFAKSDFSDPKYENHYVQFNAAVMKMTYDPYATEYILDETTEWIAFKDIPKAGNAMVFEVEAPGIHIKNQTVVMGYSYVIKIGDFTEFHSRNEYVDDRKSEETLQAIF